MVGIGDDNLYVEDKTYHLTPGLSALLIHRHPEREEYNDDDYTPYRELVKQTNVRTSPNHAGTRNPYRTWKRGYMLGKMFTPMENLPDEEEETKDSEGTETGSMEDSSSPVSSRKSWSVPPSPDSSPPSPAHTRSYYKGYKDEGVVYLPGDINGLARKLQLLAAEFFAGTPVRNELVHVLHALLRLKQLTRKEYMNITARLAA